LNNICQKIIFYTDALLIGIFLPAAAITNYAIAGNLIEYLKKIVISMASVFNPLTSELDANNEQAKIQKVLIQGGKISLLLGLPICITYFIMGFRFIGIWMGPEFAEPASQVLMILAITHLFSLPHHIIRSIFYGLSKHHILAYIRVFEAIANLSLSLLLVKHYGIVGIALGTAVPHLVSVVLVLPVLAVKALNMNLGTYIREVYIGPIFSSVPYAVLCYLAETNLKITGLTDFFGLILVLLPFYILPAWMVSFNKKERQWQLSVIIPLLRIKKG
jgi:O-antigen/teichoic acid export membrane protein